MFRLLKEGFEFRLHVLRIRAMLWFHFSFVFDKLWAL